MIYIKLNAFLRNLLVINIKECQLSALTCCNINFYWWKEVFNGKLGRRRRHIKEQMSEVFNNITSVQH